MKPSIKAEAKKKDIIDKIVFMMDDDGIKNISIVDICNATGLSVGSFYHYFKSKDDIYAEMFHQMDRNFIKNADKIQASDNEIINIKEFAMSYYKYVKNWGYYCNRVIVRYALCKDNVFFKSKNRVLYHMINSITEKAVEKRQLSDEITSENAAEMLMVLIRGYGYDWARSEPEDIAMKNFEMHLNLFLNSIAAK